VLGCTILFFQIPLNMEATELRIGNCVFNNKQIQVNSQHIKWFDEGLYHLLPMPLTEEWLLKFGFAYDGFCWSFKLHQIRLIVGSPYPYWIDSSYICDIEYVHQLQNLYFALTQQELLLTT